AVGGDQFVQRLGRRGEGGADLCGVAAGQGGAGQAHQFVEHLLLAVPQRDRPALVGGHTPDRGVHVEVCRLLSGGERERVVLRGQPQAVVVRFGLVDDGQLLLVEPGRDQLHPLPFGPVRGGGQV